MHELMPDVLDGGIEPGLVFDRTTNIDGVPERALREEYTRSITLTASHELEWYFKQLRTAEETSVTPTDTRFLDARYQFGGPHFRLLYRIWRQSSNDVIWNLLVSHVRDQMERGEGRLEFVVLPRQYLHLSHLVGVA
jgi:hypothetical protein